MFATGSIVAIVSLSHVHLEKKKNDTGYYSVANERGDVAFAKVNPQS